MANNKLANNKSARRHVGTSAMSFSWREFLMPKSGCTLVECEDAIGVNDKTLRFAVADGATEAFDAKSWSNRLVTNWTNAGVDAALSTSFDAWLAEQGEQQHESWSGLKLSWYAEEKALQGSFAAFVGVQIGMLEGRACWTAIALGDSCLIHRRGDEILLSLPLSEASLFNTSPALAPSSDKFLEKALQYTTSSADWLERGDTLWLLSDAVAAWFLAMNENDREKLVQFVSMFDDASDEALIEFFGNERQANRVKDDDIAVLKIKCE
jgi:hypothetical protein